MLRLIDR